MAPRDPERPTEPARPDGLAVPTGPTQPTQPALLSDLTERLRRVVEELAPDRLSGDDAKRVVAQFSTLERLAQAGRLLAARRVDATQSWAGGAHRSAAHWLAAETGDSVGSAAGLLRAAQDLVAGSATDRALRRGDLSLPQVREVTGAVAADPGSEQALLHGAGGSSLQALREQCRRVRAAATDQRAAYARIHRSRCLRRWTDPDGTFRLDGRLTPDVGARIWARIEDEARAVRSDARRAGTHPPDRACAADALTRLVLGDAVSAPRASIIVRVDAAAYQRGSVRPGERCEVDGAGPVPVDVVRQLAAQASLSAAVADGSDVTAVSHLGRTINARLRTALVARDPVCVVPGCGNRRYLEIDHVVPLALGGRTELRNLARLCSFHHRQKTFEGFTLAGGPGDWHWLPPPLDLPRTDPGDETGGDHAERARRILRRAAGNRQPRPSRIRRPPP